MTKQSGSDSKNKDMTMAANCRAARFFAIAALAASYATMSLAQAPPAVPSPLFIEAVSAGSSTGIKDQGPAQASIQQGGCAPINPSDACGTAFASTGAFGPSANSSTILGGGSTTLIVSAGAQAFWQFEVIDPNNTAPDALYVPVLITGLVTAATVGTNTTTCCNYTQLTQSAMASIEYGTKAFTVTSSTASGNVPENGTLFDSMTVGANALNYMNDLAVIAECSSEINGFASINGTCEASADPTITIDPTFLAANPGLSVVFSPGITPGVVPTPASGWLLISGLGALAMIQRRRLVVEGVHRQ
jgi:hypothetical protein